MMSMEISSLLVYNRARRGHPETFRVKEMPDIITLEAVYDNSDIRTDYFDSDHGIEEWYVCDIQGPVTEAKLRRAVRLLSEWLQGFNWAFRKGEKYSMSDHSYGQLRVDSETNLCFPTGEGSTSKVRFILTATFRDIFEMNDRVDNPIPQTLEAMKAFIESKIKEREERMQKCKEAQERAKQEMQGAKEVIPGVLYLI